MTDISDGKPVVFGAFRKAATNCGKTWSRLAAKVSSEELFNFCKRTYFPFPSEVFFLQSNRATERKLDPDAARLKNRTSPKALQMFTSCPLKVFAPKPDGILNVRFLWRFKVERDLL